MKTDKEFHLNIEMRGDPETGNAYIIFCQDELTQLWLFKLEDARMIIRLISGLSVEDDNFAPEFDAILAEFAPTALDIETHRMDASLSALERLGILTGDKFGGRLH